MSDEQGIPQSEVEQSVDSQAPVAPEPSSQPAPQQASPWESFKTLPEFQGQDDRAIASRLYQAMEREKVAARKLAQYQQVMPVAQEYLSNRPEYEKWRQQQAAAQAQQAPVQSQTPAQRWWNPPEIKDSYRRYLVKDETGRDTISPDAPFDARAQLTDWMNYRADFAQKFLTNPEEALGPMVAEMAQKQAQEIIERQLQTRDNEAFVQRFEEENKDWLYDSETGSVSPAGLSFHKYVDEARSHGINGPEARARYAIAMTERDLLAQKYDAEQGQPSQPQASFPMQAQQPAPEPSPQPVPKSVPDQARQNMDYLRREASRNPSRSAGAANIDPRQAKPKRSFEQMLLDEASSKGLMN
jgi:hypothetical protein